MGKIFPSDRAVFACVSCAQVVVIVVVVIIIIIVISNDDDFLVSAVFI